MKVFQRIMDAIINATSIAYLVGALVIAALFALGGCEYDARWVQGECLKSHVESGYELGPDCGMTMDGDFACPVRLHYVSRTVCDERAPPRCAPGSDGVADCPPAE